MMLLFLSWFLTCNGTKWPKLCLCAVKKLLTHTHTLIKPGGNTCCNGRNGLEQSSSSLVEIHVVMVLTVWSSPHQACWKYVL